MRFDAELDVRGLNCPLPILRTKKRIAQLARGQILKIDATDPRAAKDFKIQSLRVQFPAACGVR